MRLGAISLALGIWMCCGPAFAATPFTLTGPSSEPITGDFSTRISPQDPAMTEFSWTFTNTTDAELRTFKVTGFSTAGIAYMSGPVSPGGWSHNVFPNAVLWHTPPGQPMRNGDTGRFAFCMTYGGVADGQGEGIATDTGITFEGPVPVPAPPDDPPSGNGAIPEPGTLMLLVMGLAPVGLAVRRAVR